MSDLSSNRIYYETRELCHRDVYKHLASLRESLLQLKWMSRRALHQNTLCWQKTMLEKDQEWQERMSRTEAENKQLRTIIDQSDASKNNHKDEMDHLSWQLDKKLIHINKLQLAFAEQSKAMFELEKSYVLLYRQYLHHQKNKREESA